MSFKREVSEEEIIGYVAKKARRTARRFHTFFWEKKIERDVSRGVFSLTAEKERLRRRKDEIRKLRKEREERLEQKRRRLEERERLGQHSSRIEEFEDRSFDRDQTAAAVEKISDPEEDDVAQDSSDEYGLRKPKFITHVFTGYDWNRYNRIHYDWENRPPKKVPGYKFEIFYPDLIDKSKIPSYAVERDGDSGETCLIRFHGGAPYEDVGFRIVNEEWELSRKKGFRSTFENGVLRLHFNFKRYSYRR